MKFSIITPAFNSEKTIERTIASILNQTYHEYEYWIIDGGSKDGTIDIIKKYEPLFEGRLHWLSEPDSGIYNAMNKGLKLAKGDIIGIVNSDDWLEKNSLELVWNVIKENKIDIDSQFIITGEIRFHYADHTNIILKTSPARYEYFVKKYRMGIHHPATFVSKFVYRNIGIFDEKFRLYADADFVIRVYENNVRVIFVNKVLSNMADGGASNIPSNKMRIDTKYMLKKHCTSKIQYQRLLFEFEIRYFLKWIMNKTGIDFLRIYRIKQQKDKIR